MSEHKGIYAALSAAQGEYPEVPKRRTAKVKTKTQDGRMVEYSYKFADLSDVMGAIRPILARHGLSVAQPLETTEAGRIVLHTVLAHASGEKLESVMPLAPFPSEGKAVQTWAGVLTYARRYSLTALVGLAVEDDDDANRSAADGDFDIHDREPARQAPQPRQPPPPRKLDVVGKAPQEAVEEALALQDADPWKVNGVPVEQLVPLLETAISTRPWLEVSKMVPSYVKRLNLTEAETALVRKAFAERKDAEKQTNLLAAG
jgi:hypothetical protein